VCRPSSSTTYVRFSALDSLRVGVWGLGREIRSFVRELEARLPRATVEVVVREDPAEDASWLGGARVVGAEQAAAALAGCDVLVRSPGVSIHRAELQALNIPVVTATGLWLAERAGRRVIGVTGTKGKSTTATMVARVLEAAGEPVQLAGNIGRPALDLLDAPSDEWAVVELSSYQIADLVTGPEIAVMTNLYREHVDWHGTEVAYRAEKLRLFELPGVRTAIVPEGVEQIEAAARRGCEDVRCFGGPSGWHIADDGLRGPGGGFVAADALSLRGRHNALNLCAALAAVDAAGAERPATLPAIQPLPHRLEVVFTKSGIDWVDDSISTTPESTVAALEAFADRAVVLIGGGHDRGQDYTALGRVLAAREAAVLGLPTTGGRLVQAALEAGVPAGRARLVQTMQQAVSAARDLVGEAGVVLLSPAAPSYDTYKNFEERGGHFTALARS
jgi:UDP-N-acetylmuramoylalanine--D-glutamate ligase